MAFLCSFGIHRWDGCKCIRCGAKRDEDHSWINCRCSRCGETRDVGHAWDGCVCSVCGKEDHDYKFVFCTKCKKKRRRSDIGEALGRVIYDHIGAGKLSALYLPGLDVTVLEPNVSNTIEDLWMYRHGIDNSYSDSEKTMIVSETAESCFGELLSSIAMSNIMGGYRVPTKQPCDKEAAMSLISRIVEAVLLAKVETKEHWTKQIESCRDWKN